MTLSDVLAGGKSSQLSRTSKIYPRVRWRRLLLFLTRAQQSNNAVQILPRRLGQSRIGAYQTPNHVPGGNVQCAFRRQSHGQRHRALRTKRDAMCRRLLPRLDAYCLRKHVKRHRLSAALQLTTTPKTMGTVQAQPSCQVKDLLAKPYPANSPRPAQVRTWIPDSVIGKEVGRWPIQAVLWGLSGTARLPDKAFPQPALASAPSTRIQSRLSPRSPSHIADSCSISNHPCSRIIHASPDCDGCSAASP